MATTNVRAPGVYVMEEAGGPRPLGMVGTSVAGFVGAAPDPSAGRGDVVGINNWTEFTERFVPDGSASTDLSHAVNGFFLNGGSRCYVVNHPAGAPLTGDGGLDLLASRDDVAIVAAPGRTALADHEDLIGHCVQLDDRVAILDPRPDISRLETLTKVATEAVGDEQDDVGGDRPPMVDNGCAAFYYPPILVRDHAERRNVLVPPSGHMAGVWARNDATHGVHKAPANEPIRGALGLARQITRAEQELLNPAGVNCIRFFPNEGIRVWGARTLAPEASEWRYLNVRRLFNMVKESIAEGTRWIVFQPNDYTLWRSIRRDITAFLTRVWRDGALLGRTPEEAFFVKCDEETNPPSVRDAGQVITYVGIAPVKPAEFVIFKLSQSTDQTTISTLGG